VAAQDALARGYARGNNAGCDLINGDDDIVFGR
jgi:hypothetical protein